MLLDVFFIKLSLAQIKHDPLRVVLTFLALFIGFLTFFLLSSLAQTLQEKIQDQVRLFGSDHLVVAPIKNFQLTPFVTASALPGHLTESDWKKVKNLEGVEVCVKFLSDYVPVWYKNKSIRILVVGADREIRHISDQLRIAKGRWFQQGKEAVIGAKVPKLFDEKLGPGDYIEIGNETFRVVGILKETGVSMLPVDERIYILYDEAKNLFSYRFSPGEIILIFAKVKGDPEKIAEEVKYNLKKAHGKEFFTVITPRLLNKRIGSITNAARVLFYFVSGISIIIGILGISNTLYMNVLDNRRIIGTLRALGGTKDFIMKMFLFQGGVLAFLASISAAIVSILIAAVFHFTIDNIAVFSAIVFSPLIGVLGSCLPSKKASELPPAEAVRYE